MTQKGRIKKEKQKFRRAKNDKGANQVKRGNA